MASDKAASNDSGSRIDFFSTSQSKQALRGYLYSQVGAGSMTEDAAESIASLLDVGGLYAGEEQADSLAESSQIGAAPTNGYIGEGNMVRLGRSKTFDVVSPDNTGPSRSAYNGIWGYSTGNHMFNTFVQCSSMLEVNCCSCNLHFT